MKVKFDFIIHWLWTITFSLLALSGFSMVGAKYGWLLSFDYVTADNVHRIASAIFVILTFISICYEVLRNIKKDAKPSPFHVIGKSGFQLFTFITTLILIITGALIWVCSEYQKTIVAFALLIHEYFAFLVLASVIWHIYKKCHALIWSKKTEVRAQKVSITK